MNTRPDNGLKAKKKREFNITAGVLLSLCAGFMLWIYAPYELYFTNQQDFWFVAKHLLLPTFALFSVFFIVASSAFAIARLISDKLYYILLACSLVATVATYIQGTFLVAGIPRMDGTAYDWSQFSFERIKSIAVWVVLIAAVVFICIKFKLNIINNIVKYVSLVLIVMLSASSVSILLTYPDKNYSTVNYLKCVEHNKFEVSSDTNLFVFIIDAVDNTTFKNALNSNPELSDTFEDFTYYNNVLSGYIFTVESISFILSGDWYENDENFSVYQNNSLDQSPLIAALEENDYKIGLYADFNIRLDKELFSGRFDNFFEYGYNFKDFKSQLNVVARMAGIRYAPWDLKRPMLNLPNHIAVATVEDAGYSRYNTNNSLFYECIENENPFYLTDEKCCRIIHVDGAHTPHQYDKDMHWVEDPLEASYPDCVEGCITMTKTLIDRLKEVGAYDNSAIVIMSDHGYTQGDDQGLRGRSNPIFLAKGVGEDHEMFVSDAPISHADFAQGLTKLVNGNAGNDIFDYQDGDIRERRVMIYNWRNEHLMEEYTSTDHAENSKALQPTGNVYIRE